MTKTIEARAVDISMPFGDYMAIPKRDRLELVQQAREQFTEIIEATLGRGKMSVCIFGDRYVVSASSMAEMPQWQEIKAIAAELDAAPFRYVAEMDVGETDGWSSSN